MNALYYRQAQKQDIRYPEALTPACLLSRELSWGLRSRREGLLGAGRQVRLRRAPLASQGPAALGASANRQLRSLP